MPEIGTTGSFDVIGPSGNVTEHASTSGAQSGPLHTPAVGAVGLDPVAATKRGRAQAAQAKRGPNLPIPLVLGVVAVLGLAVLLGGFTLFRNVFSRGAGTSAAPDIAAGQTVQVLIPSGSGGMQIGEILYSAGVITSVEDFSNEVQKQGAEQLLKSGSYELVTGSPANKVVEQLVSGPNDTSGKLVIPEGLTVSQTAARAADTLGLSAETFQQAATASAFAGEFDFLADAGDDSLEGFLAPKTYDFSGQEVAEADVIRTLLGQWKVDYGALDYEGAAAAIAERYGVTMSSYDFLKLASIIEREALNNDDRPLVSSVFYNRMSKGMYLESDATMGYVTGGAVTQEDLALSSPYNTYLNAGLPPTPICTPSAESMQAALYPADTGYYFFYIMEDGDYVNHSFTETYEQHLAVIEAANNRS